MEHVSVGTLPGTDLSFGLGDVSNEADDSIGRIACNLSEELKLIMPIRIGILGYWVGAYS